MVENLTRVEYWISIVTSPAITRCYTVWNKPHHPAKVNFSDNPERPELTATATATAVAIVTMSPRVTGLLRPFQFRQNVPFLTPTLRGQQAVVYASTSHFHTGRALAEDRTPPSSTPSSLPHAGFSSEPEGLNITPNRNAPLVDRSRILNNLSESLNRLVPQRTAAAATDDAPGRSTGPGQQPRAFGRSQGAAPQGALATQEGAGAFEVTPEDMRVYEQKFGQGTVYAPNDLSMEAYMAGKKNKQQVGRRDPFKLLGIDPRMEYKVCFLPFRDLRGDDAGVNSMQFGMKLG